MRSRSALVWLDFAEESMRAWEKFAKIAFSLPSERDPLSEDGLESVSTRLTSEGVGEVGF